MKSEDILSKIKSELIYLEDDIFNFRHWVETYNSAELMPVLRVALMVQQAKRMIEDVSCLISATKIELREEIIEELSNILENKCQKDPKAPKENKAKKEDNV